MLGLPAFGIFGDMGDLSSVSGNGKGRSRHGSALVVGGYSRLHVDLSPPFGLMLDVMLGLAPGPVPASARVRTHA